MNESGIKLQRQVYDMQDAIAGGAGSGAAAAAGTSTPEHPRTPDASASAGDATPAEGWTRYMQRLGVPHTPTPGSTRKAGRVKRKQQGGAKGHKGKGASNAADKDPGDGGSDHTDSSSEPEDGCGRGGTGKPGRDKDTPRRKSSDKRDTSFSRRTHQANVNKDKLLYTAVQPSYTHIYLHKLSLRSGWKFLTDVSEYMEKTGLKVLGATLVAPVVVEKLSADYGHMTREDFYKLDNNGLYKILQAKLKPKSVVEFYKMMEVHVKFPELPGSYVPSASSFGPLYDALLMYKNEFRELFEFMCEDNADNTPDTRAKDEGLARLFTDKIPDE